MLMVEKDNENPFVESCVVGAEQNFEYEGIIFHFIEGSTSARDLVQNPQIFGLCFAGICLAE